MGTVRKGVTEARTTRRGSAGPRESNTSGRKRQRYTYIENLRRRILEEWRGLPEPDTRDRCQSVGEAIHQLVRSLGLAELLDEEQIRTAWREIVGDFLATHSLPESMRDSVLTVQVFQPTVRYELERNWKRRVLEKLQQRFGKTTIRDVRFR